MKLHSMIGIAVMGAALALPASAVVIVYHTSLSGPAESPPVASLGTGAATVTFDDVLKTMHVQTSFSGLTGNVTASHIHCCTAVAGAGTVGVATMPGTFPGFPTSVMAGSYDQTFDMTLSTSYTGAFLAFGGGTPLGAFNALISGINAGKAYFNIHTSFAPGGEIRGFLAVPEPQTLALMLAGLVGLGAVSRRRRSPR